jgi:DNA ligase-1
MRLPKLFGRNTNGSIQTWEMEVVGNKFRTHYGRIDGKITTTEWTECFGKNVGKKNATTPEEQAELEAKAKWQKKIDRKFVTELKEIDSFKFVKPMLAHKYEDQFKGFPVLSQPKLDGIRCVTSSSGMFSRQGKEIVSAPHIFESLKPIFEEYPDLIFDGELYADKLANDFNKICSLVRKTKPKPADLEESAELVEYHIYDIVDGLPFTQRYKILKDIYELNFQHMSEIVLVDTAWASNQEELDELYDSYLENGMEGQIVRTDMPYESKRSKNLLKRKEFQDAEYEIVSVEEGTGNRAGMAGYMVLRDGTRQFRSNIKGGFAFYAELLRRRDELVGKQATVQYFNLTPDNIPRFPYVIAIVTTNRVFPFGG